MRTTRYSVMAEYVNKVIVEKGVGCILTTKEIVNGCKEIEPSYCDGAFTPTDYCYNKKNNSVNVPGREKIPQRYFLWLGRGKFKCVGANYISD